LISPQILKPEAGFLDGSFNGSVTQFRRTVRRYPQTYQQQLRIATQFPKDDSEYLFPSSFLTLPSFPFPSRPSLAFVVLHIFLSAIYMKMTDCHMGCSAV
jgi:hypothetical protein